MNIRPSRWSWITTFTSRNVNNLNENAYLNLDFIGRKTVERSKNYWQVICIFICQNSKTWNTYGTVLYIKGLQTFSYLKKPSIFLLYSCVLWIVISVLCNKYKDSQLLNRCLNIRNNSREQFPIQGARNSFDPYMFYDIDYKCCVHTQWKCRYLIYFPISRKCCSD